MRSLQLYKWISLVGLSIILLASCGEKKEKQVKNGVDAEILNLQDSTVHFYSALSPLDKIKGKESVFQLAIEVDSNGIFVRPLDLSDGYYYLEYDHNKNLYFVQNGKRLSLDFDATKPTEKPDYSGRLKYESRYLYDRVYNQANFMANEGNYYAYSEPEFVETLELLRGKMDTALVMYIANHPTGSPDFMRQESLTNLYFMASYMEAYPMYRTDKSIQISEKFFHFTEVLNLNDTNAYNNPEFFKFIQNYIWNRSGLPINKTNIQNQLQLIEDKIEVTDYRDYLYFTSAKEVTKWAADADRTSSLDTLIGLITDSEIKQFLVKNIQMDTASLPISENIILEDQ
jgi:hypothetical protein